MDNPLVKCKWLSLTIKANAQDYDNQCTEFVGSVSSLKLLEPMYKAMISVDRKDEA